MSDIRVVHVSASPLVGAPLKIANLMRAAGVASSSFCENDYPQSGPLFGKFTDGSFVLNDKSIKAGLIFQEELEKCSVVHVHNYLSKATVESILRHAPHAKFVFHVHSPLKEGPLYVERSENMGIDFDLRLVVAQYQPRMYPNFVPVPNVVAVPPSVSYREDGQKLRLCFTPSHSRGGRWNAKTNEAFDFAMKVVSSMRNVEVISPSSPVAPSTLLAMRRQSHASIDEIVTGAFHQVSLESMVAGNVPINGADFFSVASLMDSFGCAPEDVPFVRATPSDLVEVISALAGDAQATRMAQSKSYDFACKYMGADHVSNIFKGVYASLFKS